MKNSLIRAIAYVLLAIYNGIAVVTGGVTLKRMAPTGVINQGILGGFSGKVGPVVGGKWKDIDYMRSYVIPANPNTTGQQASRAKFAQLVASARLLLSSVLNPFWDAFYSNMSGFNAWISQNYAPSSATGILDENAIMAKGTLEPTSSLTATYDSVTGEVVLTFSPTIFGNGLNTDNAEIVIYSAASGYILADIGGGTRGDGILSTSFHTGLTAAEVFAFMFFDRGTGSELVVSDSLGAQCTAA